MKIFRTGKTLSTLKPFALASMLVMTPLSPNDTAYGAGKGELKIVQQARYTSVSNQIQQFSTSITLSDADRAKPLTLTFYNGPDSTPKFGWVRVYLSNEHNKSANTSGKPAQPTGQMIISEATLKPGMNKIDLNFSGIMSQGTNFLVVSGAGLKGSVVGWALTSPPPGSMMITSVAPEIARGGGALTINGSGFSATAADNVVYFNQTTKATAVQASPTSIQVDVPPKLVAGNYSLQVAVRGVKTPPFNIAVGGAPELTRTDWQGGPCGQIVTIYGKNFSDVSGENTVLFGKTKAEVSSATATTLTVIVPNFPELEGGTYFVTPTTLDITVRVGTTPAAGHLGFTSARVGWKD